MMSYPAVFWDSPSLWINTANSQSNPMWQLLRQIQPRNSSTKMRSCRDGHWLINTLTLCETSFLCTPYEHFLFQLIYRLRHLYETITGSRFLCLFPDLSSYYIQLTTPLLLRKPCKLFASVARVCQRQLAILLSIKSPWYRIFLR